MGRDYAPLFENALPLKLKENYILANCCKPDKSDPITGYYSHDNVIKVHRSDCGNLSKAEKVRLLTLNWDDIIAPVQFIPDKEYLSLDELDFRVLNHHQKLGIDYSLMVAATLRVEKQTVFEKHDKLRRMGLLERVSALIVQYRKNIAKNKWIKHRNHTYYDLTEKGKKYLAHYLNDRRLPSKP